MTTNSSKAQEFWNELNSLLEEDEEAAFEYMECHFDRKDPGICFGKSADGKFLTELVCYMSDMLTGPGQRDFLDDLILAKVPVTANCYEYILDASHTYPEMVYSLLESGCLPTTIMKGEKPLDAVFDHFLNDPDFGEEHEWKSFLKVVMGKCNPQVGITHAAGGAFSECLEKYSVGNELAESKDENKESLPSALLEPASQSPVVKPSSTTASAKASAKTNKMSPTSVVAVNTNTKITDLATSNSTTTTILYCPLPGCSSKFQDEEALKLHIQTSRGKAHIKYRKRLSASVPSILTEPAAKRSRIAGNEIAPSQSVKICLQNNGLL